MPSKRKHSVDETESIGSLPHFDDVPIDKAKLELKCCVCSRNGADFADYFVVCAGENCSVALHLSNGKLLNDCCRCSFDNCLPKTFRIY